MRQPWPSWLSSAWLHDPNVSRSPRRGLRSLGVRSAHGWRHSLVQAAVAPEESLVRWHARQFSSAFRFSAPEWRMAGYGRRLTLRV